MNISHSDSSLQLRSNIQPRPIADIKGVIIHLNNSSNLSKCLEVIFLFSSTSKQKNIISLLPCLCHSTGRNLPHRGFVPEHRTTKLTSYHMIKTGYIQYDTEVECRLTFRLMAGISISDFSVKAALQRVVRGYMKELLTQTSLQNSSSPLLSLQTWTMWQQPDCFPCDSLLPQSPPPPRSGLSKGKRPHERQRWSQVISFWFQSSCACIHQSAFTSAQ